MSMSKSKNYSMYELQAEICSALSSPVRLHILDLLFTGEKTSSELLEILEIPKANLSQHLSVLKDAGILESRKSGTYQYWNLAIPKIKDACTLVRTVLLEKITQDESKQASLIKELKTARKL